MKAETKTQAETTQKGMTATVKFSERNFARYKQIKLALKRTDLTKEFREDFEATLEDLRLQLLEYLHKEVKK